MDTKALRDTLVAKRDELNRRIEELDRKPLVECGIVMLVGSSSRTRIVRFLHGLGRAATAFEIHDQARDPLTGSNMSTTYYHLNQLLRSDIIRRDGGPGHFTYRSNLSSYSERDGGWLRVYLRASPCAA